MPQEVPDMLKIVLIAAAVLVVLVVVVYVFMNEFHVAITGRRLFDD